MSQNAGTLTPARGNRRFIVLAIVLGLMGAGLVYVATSRSTTTAPPSGLAAVQPVPVVIAKVEVPARTRLTQDMLDVVLLPPAAISPLAFTEVSTALGQVTRFPLSAGEQVMASKVVSVGGISRSVSFVIPEGKRAFAISAQDVQHAAGLVLPGDYVDIYVLHDVEFLTNPADASSRETVTSFLVQVLMQNVEVLAVELAIVDVVEVPAEAAEGAELAEVADGSTHRVRNSEAGPNRDAKVVTLAVTPEEAEMLYLAEANGRIRLAVRPFGDDEIVELDYRTKLELLPSDIPSPFESLR